MAQRINATEMLKKFKEHSVNILIEIEFYDELFSPSIVFFSFCHSLPLFSSNQIENELGKLFGLIAEILLAPKLSKIFTGNVGAGNIDVK